jgi:hypothetical protein
VTLSSQNFGGPPPEEGDDDLAPMRGRAGTRVDSIWQYETAKDGGEAKRVSVRKQCAVLCKSPVWISMVFAVSALFFVVSGIQFWITEYVERKSVHCTAPIYIHFTVCGTARLTFTRINVVLHCLR